MVRLVELLDEAKARCINTIKSRYEESGEQVCVCVCACARVHARGPRAHTPWGVQGMSAAGGGR